MYTTLADNSERGKRGGGRAGGRLRELAAFLWVEAMLTRQEWVLGDNLRIIVVVYRAVNLFTQKPSREISPTTCL